MLFREIQMAKQYKLIKYSLTYGWLTFLCFLVIACVLVFIYKHFDATGKPDQIPAWFQAVGSIGAIIFALLVAIFQSSMSFEQSVELQQMEEEKEQEVKEQEQQEEIKKFITIINTTFDSFKKAVYDKPDPKDYQAFKNYYNSMNSTNPDPNIKEEHQTIEQVIDIINSVAEYNNQREKNQEGYDNFCKVIAKSYYNLFDTKTIFQALKQYDLFKYPADGCLTKSLFYIRSLEQVINEVEQTMGPINNSTVANTEDIIKFYDRFYQPNHENKTLLEAFLEDIKNSYEEVITEFNSLILSDTTK